MKLPACVLRRPRGGGPLGGAMKLPRDARAREPPVSNSSADPAVADAFDKRLDPRL